jgi:exonuclease SbcC
MRPTRLELAGFGSFREPTTVDFADEGEGERQRAGGRGSTDLFVLVGPTGAGKSTIIDALIFALYGSVPRYDDRRLVAPVINQGRVEAKVRLDFTVDGTGYTAVRVVRRTATGATTKEARLERWDPATGPRGHTVTMAGNEKELTVQVERVLGLSFDHFTRCVVLPQGAFAQFLHAKSKDRQNLLVDLLGIEVYRRIGQRARERAKQAAARIEHTRRRLEGELAGATAAELERATARVAELEALHTRIGDAQPELEALRERGVELRTRAADAAERARRLDGLAAPDGLAALATRLRDAAQARADADAAVEKAEQQLRAAESARATLPDSTVVAELVRLVADRDAREARIGPARDARDAAERDRAAATAADQAAQRELVDARAARERLRRADLARTLAAGLTPGDDCPVCERPLDHAPDHADTDDLTAADAAVTTAEQRAREATAGLTAAERTLAAREAAHEQSVAAIAELTRRVDRLAVAHDLDVAGLGELRARTTAADRDVAAARADEQSARTALRAAAAAVEQLDDQRTAAWRQFDAARDRLAALEPPPADRDDIAIAWERLLEWAMGRAPQLQADAVAAQRAVDDIADRWRGRNGELVAACRAADVAVDGGAPLPACVAALERARGDRARLATAVETATRLRGEVRDDEALADTAERLGRHLGTRRFEQWLLNQALAQLVGDASVRLRELSSGAYSLAVDDSGTFQVVDHRNADELRSARTLSGGETFLASLSLALSLADHVAQLATGASARLDALFLDEGFGTLDHDTLDVVAAALEELGSQGRTVGLVTHVRELADRMPVRFEVRRTGETSTVERVEL